MVDPVLFGIEGVFDGFDQLSHSSKVLDYGYKVIIVMTFI